MLLLSFLGEQPLPVLLPLWASQSYDATCLVPTERTEDLAKSLCAFIRQDRDLSNLQVYPYFKIAPYDLEKAEATIRKQLSHIQSSYSGAICINLTGGTKIMSMAGMLAAFELGFSMIYVATEKDSIIKMTPGASFSERQSLQVNISIEQYLSAYGIESSLDHSFSDPGLPTPHPPKEGDALEEFVYQQALDSGFFDDVKKGLFIRKFSHRSEPIINELDVVVIRNGRLAVCSCKSGKYSKAYLAELEAVTAREKFGIYCGKVFASNEGEFSEYRKKEFRMNKVSLVYGSSLEKVAEFLLAATEV
jgi:hypothetical protein